MSMSTLVRWGTLTTLIVASSVCSAKEVAVCGASEGFSYFPDTKLAPKDGAGIWAKDRISGGRFTISRGGPAGDQWDVLFADSTNRVVSSSQDGGTVIVMGKSPEQLLVVVAYPRTSVEAYSVYRKKSGGIEMAYVQNRSGPGALIDKISAFVAPCTLLDTSD